MRFTFAASVILAAALAFMALINPSNSTSAQTDCVQALSSAAVEGYWSADCPSRSRDSTYARFYTFTLYQEAEVTITLESETDPYLYLLDDSTAIVAENDDIDYDARNLNSRISHTLGAGDYIIEATTYNKAATGDFTLTIEGIDLTASEDSDRAALTALYHATDGPNWTNNDNWLTDAPLDDWYGVYSTNDEGRITDLQISSNGLKGHIPPEIGNLEELQLLSIRANQLTGEVPPELGRLVNLKHLDLSHNNLSGELPHSLKELTSLSVFYFGDNAGLCAPNTDEAFMEWLRGVSEAEGATCSPLPPHNKLDLVGLEALYYATDGPNWGRNDNWLTNAPLSEWHGVSVDFDGRVDELNLNHNRLIGEFPFQLNNLTNLKTLNLRVNQLSGEIPPQISELINLRWISLSNNHLSGNIPPELGNLTSLEGLYLAENRLIEDIPEEISNLTQLRVLYLDGNDLTLPVSTLSAMSNLPNLSALGLASNRLSGEISSEFGKLKKLRQLRLWGNQLTGEIPLELSNLANMEWLQLGRNQLTGEIPPELDVLTDLELLDLGENRLTGQIPGRLGNLTNLESLFLEGNQLTGPIPRELGNLASLDELFLAGNQLIGCVPNALRDVESNDLDELGLPFCEDTQPPTPPLPDCVESLPSDRTVSDTWNTDCTSNIDAPSGSGDRYARFFTFTLDAESDVTIDLSSDKDTYLYLRSGASTDGTVTHENDDRATDNYDSMIEERLDSGTYTVEATTYAAGVTGSFTLAVTVVPVPDTTELEPPPGPAPDPTTLIPESCALQSFSGTSVNDSWTSDCVSQNRTENGAHYAKFFSFSVSRSATYDITLVSRTDPYLILLDSAGDIIDSDDDDDNGLFNLGSRNSGIRIALDPGDYIFEATTYAGSATGDFTLTILRPELVALRALYNATDGAN